MTRNAPYTHNNIVQIFFYSDNEDLCVLQTKTKQLLLLARIREKGGHINASLSTLQEARDNQYRMQKRISLEQAGGLQEQYKILSK